MQVETTETEPDHVQIEIESDESEASYTEAEKLEHLKKWENSNLEILLRTWGEKAAGLRWMHIHSTNFWRTTDQKLNMIGIVLSSIVSASSLLGAFESFVNQSYIMTFVGFLSMFNILNQSMLRFYNCTEKATLHETASRQFGNFQRFVSTKLSLSRFERGPPKQVLDFALRENDRIYKDNIEPHVRSIDAFLYHFKDKIFENDFSIPDYVSDTLKIQIFNNDPSYIDLMRKSYDKTVYHKQIQKTKSLNPLFQE
jgi:hypothetical protein